MSYWLLAICSEQILWILLMSHIPAHSLSSFSTWPKFYPSYLLVCENRTEYLQLIVSTRYRISFACLTQKANSHFHHHLHFSERTEWNELKTWHLSCSILGIKNDHHYCCYHVSLSIYSWKKCLTCIILPSPHNEALGRSYNIECTGNTTEAQKKDDLSKSSGMWRAEQEKEPQTLLPQNPSSGHWARVFHSQSPIGVPGILLRALLSSPHLYFCEWCTPLSSYRNLQDGLFLTCSFK